MEGSTETNEKIENEDLQKFENILNDFANDIKLCFPEYEESILKLNISKNKEKLYNYCKKQFCPHFFNILYKNEKMFEIDESNNEYKGLYLLPLIDFKQIYNLNISENTKNTIWNYLQLLLFTCVKNIQDESVFGETSKLFEAIDQNELQEKLVSTMESLNNVFQNMNQEQDESEKDVNNDETQESSHDNDETQESTHNNDESNKKQFNPDDFKNFFNPEDINSHLSGIMDGKIGQLAKEIAGEAMESLDLDDIENSKNPDVFMKKMLNDPTKIMKLVKQIGGKLDTKLKDGSINKDDLVNEAGEIMEKIQSIPGLKDVMGKMGMNGKMDFKGMMNKMQNNMKSAQTKERMREKLKKRQQESNLNNNPNIEKKTDHNYVFRPEMNGTQEGFSPFMDDEPILKSSKKDKPKTNNKKKNKKKTKTKTK